MTIMLSRFHLILERHGRTDGHGQTDMLYQYRASMCSVCQCAIKITWEKPVTYIVIIFRVNEHSPTTPIAFGYK